MLYVCNVCKCIDKIDKMCYIGNDGYLKWLHCLMLMDDTVILATSRDKCLNKLKVLLDYCIDYGIVINEKKTKFMAINTDDKTSMNAFFTDGKVKYTIDHCDSYVYLGCIFTCDVSINTALKQHFKTKRNIY